MQLPIYAEGVCEIATLSASDTEIQFVKVYFYLEEHIIKLIFALIKQKSRRLKS